jgi:hypothetical protein
MRAKLYLEITEQLKTILDENGEPLFKHVDLWNQNVDFIEQETPFDMPAVFVEFLPITWQTLAGRCIQQANLILRLHIVTRWHSPTGDGAADQAEAIAYLDIPNWVVKVMQNFCPTGATPLMRTQSVINHNHAEIIDSTEDFTTSIKDVSAMPQ